MIDDDSLRGSHVVRLFGSATIPGAAGASGKSPAEIVSIGTGIDDAEHEDFYICSATPCIEPPDPNVAHGPDHVVQTAGALIRVTNVVPRCAADRRHLFVVRPAGRHRRLRRRDGRLPGRHRPLLGASTSWYCGADPIGFLDVGVSATGDLSGVWWIYSFWFPDSVPTSPSSASRRTSSPSG